MILLSFTASQFSTHLPDTQGFSRDFFHSQRRRKGQKPGTRFLQLLPVNVPLRYRFRLASTADLVQDVTATAAVITGAYGLVFIFNKCTQQKLINQYLASMAGTEFEQKACSHTFRTALYDFMANFQDSNSTHARYFAAFVPLVNCLRLVVNGLSLTSDEGLIKSVSREGNPEELLKGPLYYVLVLISCALLFWRQSPVSAISLAMMCGGDGVADIIGRRFGTMKIPYNPRKSWEGSISMFVFGFLISLGLLYYYSFLGYLNLDWGSTVLKVALISLVATVVESLPTEGGIDDNLSVPLASMLMASMIFRS